MLPTAAPPSGASDQLVAARRTADDRIARAIDLGWRFAALRATTVQFVFPDRPRGLRRLIGK